MSDAKKGMAGAMRAVAAMKKVILKDYGTTPVTGAQLHQTSVNPGIRMGFKNVLKLTQRQSPSTLSNVHFNLSEASGQRLRIDPRRIPYRVIR